MAPKGKLEPVANPGVTLPEGWVVLAEMGKVRLEGDAQKKLTRVTRRFWRWWLPVPLVSAKDAELLFSVAYAASNTRNDYRNLMVALSRAIQPSLFLRLPGRVQSDFTKVTGISRGEMVKRYRAS